jgi:hypothetical protein
VEVPEMAAMILILAGGFAWLDVKAMRNLARRSLREAQSAYQAPPGSRIEDRIAQTAIEITALLDLRACWFEPFPFDVLLPRIEQGRIVLPMPEPGVAPCSDAGVELPVRVKGLTVGRFVLLPSVPTVGVVFSPTERDRAIAMAGQLGAPVATALISGTALT